MPWMPRNFLALLIASMACWLERHAAAEIKYLKAENRALRARLGRRRILFTDAERQTPSRSRRCRKFTEYLVSRSIMRCRLFAQFSGFTVKHRPGHLQHSRFIGVGRHSANTYAGQD